MGKQEVRLTISGFVQGVGYRAWAHQKALDLGLVGWAKNNTQDQVKIVVQGRREALEEFIRLCQAGPDRAKVSRVEARWQKPSGVYHLFEILD